VYWTVFKSRLYGFTGPLLAYEVLTAFFLEAGFLGVMLFGWNRVGPGLHLLSTVMVAVGTLISATWIIASNSWMQTPQGYEIIDGRAVPTDWVKVIFMRPISAAEKSDRDDADSSDHKET